MLIVYQAKKLISILVNFLSIIITKIKAVLITPTINNFIIAFSLKILAFTTRDLILPIKYILYIHYLIYSKKIKSNSKSY